MKTTRVVFAGAVCVLCGAVTDRAAAQERWQGKVVGVADGDIFTVLRDGARVVVELVGVDCPERAQPFGKQARQHTARLALGKLVQVQAVKTAKPGRTLARVHLPDGTSLGSALVKAGLGWQRREAKDKQLAKLEREARAARRGLWADDDPVAPWIWRRQRRRVAAGQRKDRECKRDEDCTLRPQFACDPCLPCGTSWRVPINVWTLKRIRKQEELKDCHRRCPRCKRNSRGTKAVCREGQCTVKP